MFKKFVGLGLVTLAAGVVVYTVAQRIKGNDNSDENVEEAEDEVLVETEEENCACKPCACEDKCECEETEAKEE